MIFTSCVPQYISVAALGSPESLIELLRTQPEDLGNSLLKSDPTRLKIPLVFLTDRPDISFGTPRTQSSAYPHRRHGYPCRRPLIL